MGKVKYLATVMRLFDMSPVVDFASIKKITRNNAYAKLLIHQLVKKGRIHKLAKGIYSKHDNPELVVFAFKPAYFGLQDALSHHQLWEQETIPVIITSRHVRTGLRTVLGSNVLVRRVDTKFLFGYDYAQHGTVAYPYSDIEKTLIDMIYFKQPIRADVLKKMRAKLNKNKLDRYLKRYDEKVRKNIHKLLAKSHSRAAK